MRKIIALVMTLILFSPIVKAQEKPLVVVSLPSIASIIQEALGESVEVVYLVPPGVEPHQYQLSPEQVSLLRRADVIVTTGHLPAELKIEELKKSGEIRGVVLGIKDYESFGFRYLPERWYEGKSNPHGIWLDPKNALAIAKATEQSLVHLYPELSEELNERIKIFETKIRAIEMAYAGILKGKKAVVELPSQQYALEWLGIEVIESIKPEAEIPAKSVDSLASVGADLVVYDEATPENLKDASKKLSERLGIPIANVTVLWVGKNYSQILVENARSIVKAMSKGKVTVVRESGGGVVKYSLVSLVVGVVVGIAIGVLIRKCPVL
ncbi:hypothetical protein PNA2_1151 [Pyrococcus sp. NA2]|uniref:metal ABC transporter solute-binding protein, Zn/Mn family n=1 Tax=Pyrococcus sp. (strain NA2) TaxID=342949 RepID=UPI000209AB6F|nr:zinc ABC transporter substrate-binding protein [Pyrococcus sp. NA2]AEC52067.1 hypothetical protein PNA2_1151 [Pyrococcus sp. NA2]